MTSRTFPRIAVLACLTLSLGGCKSSDDSGPSDVVDGSLGNVIGGDASRDGQAGGNPDAQSAGDAGGGGDGSVNIVDGQAPDGGGVTNPDGGTGQPDGGVVTGQSKYWVSGYYAAYQRDSLPPAQIDWTGLSHIIFTRIKTNGGGTLQLDFDVDATAGPALARDIAQKAHQNGRKALLMLGGAQQGTGIRNSSSNANRAKFVTALLKAVTDYGYDGLDLDWEDDLDYDLFASLARDLRNSPNAPAGLILTAPGWAINSNNGSVDPKIAKVVESLDQYSLMSYYPATAYAGSGWQSWHNCPLSGLKATTPVTIEDSLARHAATGIPKAKLGMGVAFYAICYTGSVTGPNQSTSGSSIEGGDNSFPLSALFANGGAFNATYRKWDDAAKVPYLSLPTADSHGCRYISFDDEQSLEAKGKFTRDNGYGGVIIWTINQGYLKNSSKAPNALMQALKRGFLDP